MIGKNVPEKRNIGTTPKRKIALNPLSESVLAAYASTGAENASPVRSAAGTAKTASHDWMPPNTAITATYALQLTRIRIATKIWCPARMLAGPSGVAAIAKY